MTEEEIVAAADAIIRKRAEPLGELWVKSNSDWYLNMSWSMTEPVCPFAAIQEENTEKATFGCWANGPVAAMLKSIDAARAALEKKE